MVTAHSNFSPPITHEWSCILWTAAPAPKPKRVYQVPPQMLRLGIYAFITAVVATVFALIVRYIYVNARRPDNPSVPPNGGPAALPPILSTSLLLASSSTTVTPTETHTSTPTIPILPPPIIAGPGYKGRNPTPPSLLRDRVTSFPSNLPRRKSDSDLLIHGQAAALAVTSSGQEVQTSLPRYAATPSITNAIDAAQLAQKPQSHKVVDGAVLITSQLGQSSAAVLSSSLVAIETLSDSVLRTDFGLEPTPIPATKSSYLDQVYQQILEQIRYYHEIRDSFWQKSRDLYDHLFGQHGDNPCKLQKYRVAIAELRRGYGEQALDDDMAAIHALQPTPFVNACKDLIEILNRPNQDPRLQYQHFVMALRDAVEVEDSEQPQEVCSRFVGKLSYLRFTGIQIFSFLKELVNLAVEGTLPNSLTLPEFLPHFLRCNQLADKLHKIKQGNSRAVSTGQKLEGHLNWADFLKDRNVPYVDGMMTLEGRTITMLRHGVPITHYEKSALFIRGLSKVWQRLTNVRTDPKQYFMASERPKITADYLRCTKHANEQNQKVLHICLEDGEMKTDGDESGRYDERLKLNNFVNVFALALRMDGDFFKNCIKSEPFKDLRARFKEQLFGLKGKSFFYIPEKILQQTNLLKNFDLLLEEVKNLYFSSVQEIESIHTHQAFLMLSYAHITLYICQHLGISILEALCKDDIDRGRIFKTILWLHFLYLTNQITSDNLIKILVLTLAAPISVKKQGVIHSRVEHLTRTMPFIVEAHKQDPVPPKMLAGRDLGETSFNVLELPNQGFQAVAAS